MEILTNKDKILENHQRHVAQVEGKPFKEVVTKTVTPDDLAEIKQILMVILGKVRGIDAYVRTLNAGHIRRSGGTFHAEPEKETNVISGELE